MGQVTITEALAELKTIGKQLEAKRTFALNTVARPASRKDPHERHEGGSPAVLASELQGIYDLEERTIRIRGAIAMANRATTIKVGERERTIEAWLSWRRDVAPGQKQLLTAVTGYIAAVRDRAKKNGGRVNPSGDDVADTDVIVHMDEAKLAAEVEALEVILGTLDGQLSLKNATTVVEIA